MNIFKILRKPLLPSFLALLVSVVSCTQDEQDNNEPDSVEFDFSFYENNKGNLIDLKSFTFTNKSSLSRLETNDLILNEINNQLGSDLDFSTSFKELELDSYETISDYIYENNIMDEKDMQILTNFHTNLSTLELSEAMTLLKEDVDNANLNSYKIRKFQYLANVVQLIENETPGFYTSDTIYQRSCFGALLGLGFASAGLVAACNPPALGATVGTACYLAAANFVRASAYAGIECGNKT